VLTAFAQQGPQYVIDFAALSGMSKSMGIPGSSVSSSDQTKPYDLDIRPTIERTETQGTAGFLTIAFKVFNRGTRTLYIPSCVDQTKAHKRGNTDRRVLVYGIDLTAESKTNHQVLAVAFGSDTDKDCLARLDPGRYLLAKVAFLLPSKPKDSPAPNASLEIRGFMYEYRLQDRDFAVSTRSKEVFTQNSLTIYW
jgi:hypothetical protein